MSSLQVYTRRNSNGQLIELWKQEGSSGRDWHSIQYSVQAHQFDYDIVFEATRGRGPSTIISLDDITVQSGEITPMPKTSISSPSSKKTWVRLDNASVVTYTQACVRN